MDELPPKAAALLAAARRAHEPSAADGERVRAALKASLALPLHPELAREGAAPELASTAPSSLAPALGKLLVLLSLAGGALWWGSGLVRRPTSQSAPVSGPSTHVSPSAPPREPVPSALAAQPATQRAPLAARLDPHAQLDAHAQETTPAAQRREPSGGRSPRAASATSGISAMPVVAAPVAVRDKPAAATAKPRSALGSSATHAPVEHDATSESARAATAPDKAQAPAGTPDQPGAAPAGDHDELALIRAALGRLNAGDAAGALQLLDHHAARYAHGVMAEERVGLRAIALCAAGEGVLGRAEQQRFLGMAPSSPLAARVRAACETAP
jgi:hypothetical protein